MQLVATVALLQRGLLMLPSLLALAPQRLPWQLRLPEEPMQLKPTDMIRVPTLVALATEDCTLAAPAISKGYHVVVPSETAARKSYSHSKLGQHQHDGNDAHVAAVPDSVVGTAPVSVVAAVPYGVVGNALVSVVEMAAASPETVERMPSPGVALCAHTPKDNFRDAIYRGVVPAEETTAAIAKGPGEEHVMRRKLLAESGQQRGLWQAGLRRMAKRAKCHQHVECT